MKTSTDELLSEISPLIARLEGASHRVAVVGGAVRDALEGHAHTDIDLATSALPEEVMALVPEARPTGVAFGTVTIMGPRGFVHVTTFRSEKGYSDRRHPDAVSFSEDLAGDLRRRDFTVNAMALLPDGSLVDPLGGREDLRRRLLRTVGAPDERFREDALRRLRLFRFVSEEGFAVEEATMRAALHQAGTLRLLAPERCWVEVRRLLVGPHAERALQLGKTVLQEVLPWAHEAPLETLPMNVEIRLAAIGRGGDAERIFEDLLRMGAGRIRALRVARFVRIANDPPTSGHAIRSLAASLPLADLEALSSLTGHDAFNEALALRTSGRLPLSLSIDGHDLTAAFQKAPGPWVGRTLRRLWEAVLAEPTLNDEAQLLMLAAEEVARDEQGGPH